MAINTIHLVIGVILINSMIAVSLGVYETQTQGQQIISTELQHMAGVQDIYTDQLNERFFNHENGTRNTTGTLRTDSGDTPQFAEASINLGSNLGFWELLTVHSLLPIQSWVNAGTFAAKTDNQIEYLALILIQWVLVGINLAMYLRFFNIIYSKFAG